MIKNKTKVFVIMPFTDDFFESYEMIKLLNYFEETIPSLPEQLYYITNFRFCLWFCNFLRHKS